MFKRVLTFVVLLCLCSLVSSQTIPTDSLFLGQKTPGAIPEKFVLPVKNGSFAAERITVSNDGKEICYSEVRNYYPVKGDTIKCYSYTDSKWQGPFNLFEGYLAPELSITGDTMYFEKAGTTYETFYSVRKGKEWDSPRQMLKNLNSPHYLQVTSGGNYYVSLKSVNTVGNADWCKLILTDNDTLASSLGRPLNTEWDNLDFYIPRDESYIILTTISGLAISYPKLDGNWTSPRNLGKHINFGLASWGPYVTPDKKYLFYTTGTKPDYSDTGIFWVRIDNLIDSLKNTNNVPYLQRRLENKAGFVNQNVDFTIPDDAFLDDDSESTFSYTAFLNTGEPLPGWLTFDKLTGRFHGLPSKPAEYTVIVAAADNENAQGLGVFMLSIKEKQ